MLCEGERNERRVAAATQARAARDKDRLVVENDAAVVADALVHDRPGLWGERGETGSTQQPLRNAATETRRRGVHADVDDNVQQVVVLEEFGEDLRATRRAL